MDTQSHSPPTGTELLRSRSRASAAGSSRILATHPELRQGCFIARPPPQGDFAGWEAPEGEEKGAAPHLNFPALASPRCTWPVLPPRQKRRKLPWPPLQTSCVFGQRLVPPMPPPPSIPTPQHATRREARDSDRDLPPLLGLLGHAQKGHPAHGYGMGEAGRRDGHF